MSFVGATLTTIITCRRHATDYELLSFQSGGGRIGSIHEKKREREKNSGICLISSSVVRFPRPSRRPIGEATGGGRRMLTRAIIKFEWERLESACNCLLFDPPVPIKRINELIVTAGRPRLQRISKFCFITGWILENLRSRGSKIERI